MAVRFPMHGVVAARERISERVQAHLFIFLGRRGLAGDHAARKDDVGIVGTGGLGKTEQGILAGAAGADHQNQPAGSDRGCTMIRDGRCFRHATRRPSRQTLRTTGISRATWTRIRSARLPLAISPRSESPTASAGVLVTVRMAGGRTVAP